MPYINYIDEKLSLLCTRVKLRGSLGLSDLSIHSENFFRDLLNLLFGWKIENLNYEIPNTPGIDLVYDGNGIVVQVTATASKDKIESSLAKANPKKYKGYKFKFVFIVEDAKQLRGKTYLNPNNFNFDNINDIYDAKSLLKEINNTDTSRLSELYQFFKSEVEPTVPVGEKFLDKHEEHIKTVPKPPEGYISRTVTSLSDKRDEREFAFFQKGSKTLFQAIEEENRIILLGDGGIGKTTELLYLFHEVLEKDRYYPIHKSLCNYTATEKIEDFLRIPLDGAPKEKLLLIFDGLDEAISCNGFSQNVQRLNDFFGHNKEMKILVSCRTNFYNIANDPLTGFKVFYLNELGHNDISKYLRQNHKDVDAGSFYREVSVNNYHDLSRNPFYLNILAEEYEKRRNLSISRAELFRSFIEEKIDQDSRHNKLQVNLEGKESEVKQSLEMLAISLEIKGRNSLEKDELQNLLSQCEQRLNIKYQLYDVLKYYSILRRRFNEKEYWQFEHNNIQEYMAAYALSNMEYHKILKLVSINKKDNIISVLWNRMLLWLSKIFLSIPGTPISIPLENIIGNRSNRIHKLSKKIAPTWLNTMSFLFSIWDKEDKRYQKLLERLILNEKEVIVSFEPDKLRKDIRNNVFQAIFSTYKEENLWINTNKFSLQELARFGQSDENIDFLINEMKDSKNTDVIYRESMTLLCLMDIESDIQKQEIKELMFKHIKKNYENNDSHDTSACINTLRYIKIVNEQTVRWLIKEVGDSKDAYIRASIYSILSESSIMEEYLDYLIEGYKLWRKRMYSQNESLHVNEKIGLEDCLGGIKSPDGIKKIIKELINTDDQHSSSDDWVQNVMSNAILAYDYDKTIYDSMLDLFLNEYIHMYSKFGQAILTFFDTTNTREQTFDRVWSLGDEINEWTKQQAIVMLINSSMVPYILEKYRNDKLSEQDIRDMYNRMCQLGNTEAERYREMIEKNTDIRIEKNVRRDFAAENKEKTQQEFNLLFDPDSFKRELLRVFEEEGTDRFSRDDLFHKRSKGGISYYIQEKYSGLSISILRNSTINQAYVTKQEIEKSFDNQEYDYVRISYIEDYLEGHKDIVVSSEQKKWITEWCQEKAIKVDFRKAITKDPDGGISYNRLVSLVAYFSIRFDIEHKQNVLLDMLSFETSVLGGGLFNYALSKLSNPNIIKDRVLQNLRDGIDDDNILLSHCSYLAEKKVSEAYPFIIKEILNPSVDAWFRIEILKAFDVYVSGTNYLKDIVKDADLSIKWHIVDLLIEKGEKGFVVEFLHEDFEILQDYEEKGKATERLVRLSDLKGLGWYVEWIDDSKIVSIGEKRAECLNGVNDIGALNFLMKLLQIDMIRKIKIEGFSSYRNIIIRPFYNIAEQSEKNLEKVIKHLKRFIDKNEAKYADVRYIYYELEKIEDHYYMNQSRTVTIEQVKEKLKMIYAK